MIWILLLVIFQVETERTFQNSKEFELTLSQCEEIMNKFRSHLCIIDKDDNQTTCNLGQWKHNRVWVVLWDQSGYPLVFFVSANPEIFISLTFDTAILLIYTYYNFSLYATRFSFSVWYSLCGHFIVCSRSPGAAIEQPVNDSPYSLLLKTP